MERSVFLLLLCLAHARTVVSFLWAHNDPNVPRLVDDYGNVVEPDGNNHADSAAWNNGGVFIDAHTDPNAQHPVNDDDYMAQPGDNDHIGDYDRFYQGKPGTYDGDSASRHVINIALGEREMLFAAIAMSLAFCVSFGINVYLCQQMKGGQVYEAVKKEDEEQ